MPRGGSVRRLVLLGLALAACAPADAHAPPARTSATGAPTLAGAPAPPADDPMAARLDSGLARLRAGLPVVTRLDGGESSRDALVRRFVRAVAGADTAELRRMMMTRAEFAHLYYPGSAFTRPPTRQEADLVWFLHLRESEKGASRLLARYGAAPLEVLDYACEPDPVTEGANRLWHGCRVTIAQPTGPVRLRLFGPILERDGQYKLYSFRNDL